MKTVNKFASQRKQWIDSIRLSPLGGLLSLTVHADEMWGRNVGCCSFWDRITWFCTIDDHWWNSQKITILKSSSTWQPQGQTLGHITFDWWPVISDHTSLLHVISECVGSLLSTWHRRRTTFPFTDSTDGMSSGAQKVVEINMSLFGFPLVAEALWFELILIDMISCNQQPVTSN